MYRYFINSLIGKPGRPEKTGAGFGYNAAGSPDFYRGFIS